MLNTSRSCFQTDRLENNDDEMERSSRRRQSEKRMSTTVSRNIQFITDAKSKMTNYMQLFSENKIVASNVWLLNAIECLKVIVDTDTNNLLNIGPDALEVGTKVYTVRVDDTYNQTLKISHDLASKVGESNLENENLNGDGDDDQGQSNGPKRKRARLTTSSFIVKNEKEIQGEIATKGSVFSKLLSDLNDKGEKYFMGSLPIDPRNGCQQLLFEQFDDEDYAAEKSKEAVKDDDEIEFNLPEDHENVICAPLTNHSLSIVNQNITMFFDELGTETFVTDTEGNPVFDVSFLRRQTEINRSCNDNNDDDDDNDNGHFGDKDNVIVNRIVGNNGNITIGENANGLVNNCRFIDNLEPNSILICDRNDYMHAASEYRANASLRNMWAGPQHWKLKLMGRRPTGGSAVAERAAGAFGSSVAAATAAARKRALQAKRKEELIEFNEIPYSYDQYDASLVDGITKRYRCFSDDEHANSTKVCLVPVKHEFTIDRLNTLMADQMTLMMLPASRNGLKNGAVAVTVADNDNANGDDDDDDLVSRPIDRSHYLDDDLDNVSYNYDNPNDLQFSTPVDESFGSLGMVKAPGKIPEVKIDYDKKPSNIDIKELKNGLRKQIEEHIETKVDFLEIFCELPERLPSKMKGRIDLAVAFSGLLQVAYETQAISLTAKSDGGITIEKK